MNSRLFWPWSALPIAVALAGCSSAGSTTGAPAPTTAPEGSGTVTGTAGGHATSKVAAAYFIGQSDDPVNTTVIYAFDTPVSCGDLAAAGWDTRIADQTGAVEIKLLGTTAATYPVSTTPSGAAGEALVNFTVSSTSATPKESVDKSGSVTLDSLEAGYRAKGSFDLTFADGTLTGTFDAAWCAGGHEP